MATVTHALASTDTANVTSYVSGAFTPVANDLIVVFVSATATSAAGTMTDSQGLGFTKITSAVKATSLDTSYLFIANALAAASSMTVTFDCTGDSATGAAILIARVSGMTKTGATASLQTATHENTGGANTPAPVFASSALTGNPTLGLVANATNPATMTPPTDWTELADVGFSAPVSGAEYVSRDSGFTGTTITWGSTGGTGFCAIIVELDASGSGTAAVRRSLPLRQAVHRASTY